MKRSTLGISGALLSTLLWAAQPVLAGPVEMTRVKQVLQGNYQQGGADTRIDLRLAEEGNNDPKKKPAQPATGGESAPPPQERAPITVQEEIQEEVTVENCDCPDLPLPLVAKGGFPKWLFGLAAIPLICVTGICSGDDTPPDFVPPPIGPPPAVTPTPSGTPPVPEPASILLLGSGLVALGAAARRRHARNKAATDDGI